MFIVIYNIYHEKLLIFSMQRNTSKKINNKHTFNLRARYTNNNNQHYNLNRIIELKLGKYNYDRMMVLYLNLWNLYINLLIT